MEPDDYRAAGQLYAANAMLTRQRAVFTPSVIQVKKRRRRLPRRVAMRFAALFAGLFAALAILAVIL